MIITTLPIMHFKALRLNIVFMAIPLFHDIDRESHNNILPLLSGLIDAGQVKPLIDCTYSLTLRK